LFAGHAPHAFFFGSLVELSCVFYIKWKNK
jgi:hypothetical protein